MIHEDTVNGILKGTFNSPQKPKKTTKNKKNQNKPNQIVGNERVYPNRPEQLPIVFQTLSL